MKKTNGPPTFDEMLEMIASLVPALYEATERAIQQARGFFESLPPDPRASARPIDPSLFPNLFRYFAKEYLDEAGQSVDYFEREGLPNNGLLVYLRGLQIRILKADAGRVPLPGTSGAKVAYYNQETPYLPFPGLSIAGEPPEQWNLLVLWDVTASYSMMDLRLALPKSATEESVDLYWIGTIPNPILQIRSEEPDAQQPSDDLDDISRREKETGEESED